MFPRILRSGALVPLRSYSGTLRGNEAQCLVEVAKGRLAVGIKV